MSETHLNICTACGWQQEGMWASHSKVDCLRRQIAAVTKERDEARLSVHTLEMELAKATLIIEGQDAGIKELQAECGEQCRLLGISGSREAALLAERDALKVKIDECYEAWAICRQHIHAGPHSVMWDSVMLLNRHLGGE